MGASREPDSPNQKKKERHRRRENESAMQSGVYFSVLALLLRRALLVIQEEAETTDRRAERLGIVRYRRKLLVENRGKVMVWTDGFFGILDMNEMMALLGVLKT